MSTTLFERIKQTKPFADSKEEAYLLLLRTGSQYGALLNQIYFKYNLNTSTYNILRILRGQKDGSLPITEIAKRMVVRAPDITRCIEKLVKLKLVEKKKSSDDKRVTVTTITQEGQNLLTLLDKPVQTAILDSFSMLNEDEIKQFINITNKMQDHFNDSGKPRKNTKTNDIATN